METRYLKYYINQSGRGLSDIGVLHRSPLVLQQGRGVGDFFSAVFRTLKPLLSSGLNTLKDQSIKTGSAILADLKQKPLKDILKEQGTAALQELTEKGLSKIKRNMQGKGIKRKITRSRPQSIVRRSKRKTRRKPGIQKGGRKRRRSGKRRTARTVKRKRVLDIFD